MLTVEEAQARIAELIEPVETELVSLANAGGRVLRASAQAHRAQPPFAASAMDGYAVRFDDVSDGAQLRVVGEIAAGHSQPISLKRGEAARIFTGAPLPEGADHILIQEDTKRDGDTITVQPNFDAHHYVRPAGGDFPAGFELPAPRRLTASDVALLAAMNAPEVSVARKPIVAIIPTGDELVWPREFPRGDQIVASNNFGLKAMLDADGADTRLLPIAKDTPEALRETFALADGADLIVTLGGASVGDHDLVQGVAVDQGLDLSFYKLAMRPGKPLMAGRLGKTPMIGLPGNPVSSMVCAHVFLRPALRSLLGLGYVTEPVHNAVLSRNLGANGPRAHYMRSIIEKTDEGWTCTPNERQDSSLLSVLSASNGLMIRPAQDPARNAGDTVSFMFL